jgi:hypothetical protein
MSENLNETTPAVSSDVVAISGSTLANELASMNSGVGPAVLSTIRGTDHASKLGTIDALTNAVPLADNLGKTINLVNVVIQSVEMPDERTGVIAPVPRVTLIDADGSAYHAMSAVVYTDLKNFFGILGMPHTWPAPLPVAASKAKAKTGQYMTLSLVKSTK